MPFKVRPTLVKPIMFANGYCVCDEKVKGGITICFWQDSKHISSTIMLALHSKKLGRDLLKLTKAVKEEEQKEEIAEEKKPDYII